MSTDTMTDAVPVPNLSRISLWTGRILTGLSGLFLVLDAVLKLVKPDFIVKATEEAGMSPDTIVPLGTVLLASSLLYLIPGPQSWEPCS